MLRVLTISMVLLCALPVVAETELSDTAAAVAPASRTQIEKKYSLIERNLKSSAKFRLSYIVSALYDGAKNGKPIDFRAIAKTEIGKQFSIATAEQKEALLFYAIAGAMKKVEADIEEMKDKRSETSTVFSNLSLKANEFFDILTEVIPRLKELRPKTIATIL